MANRESNARVTATLDGKALGVFEERTGGDSDSTSVSYSMGGMGPRRALGGRPEVSNVIVKGLFDEAARGNYSWARQRAGKGVFVITEQPLDDEGVADGDPTVWNTILKSVKPPPRNSEADAAAQWELEGTVDGPVA